MQEKLSTERQREEQTCDIVQFLSFPRVQKGSYNFLQRSIFTIYQRHVSSWQYNYVFCRALRIIHNNILKITCFTSSIQMGHVMFFVGETSLSVTNFSSAGFIILNDNYMNCWFLLKVWDWRESLTTILLNIRTEASLT